MAILARGVYQPVDLARGEVTPFDCQALGVCFDFVEADFIEIKHLLLAVE
jgi:hypothetical protein